MNLRLEQLVDNLSIINRLFGSKVFLTVMDQNRIVQGVSVPDRVVPQVRVGEAFHDPTGALDKVLRTGEPQHNYLPKEVMGEALEGELVPIKDGGDIVGCIICTYSVDTKEEMASITTKFQESVHRVDESLHTLVDGIEKLFQSLLDMDEMANHVDNDVQDAVKVVNGISNNASRSNILALNASIEAARSGKFGQGFTVVASQMGKLAKDSGNSAAEIKTTLSTITEHLDHIISSIKDAGNFAKEQHGNIRSIEEVLEEMLALAKILEEDIKLR